MLRHARRRSSASGAGSKVHRSAVCKRAGEKGRDRGLTGVVCISSTVIGVSRILGVTLITQSRTSGLYGTSLIASQKDQALQLRLYLNLHSTFSHYLPLLSLLLS